MQILRYILIFCVLVLIASYAFGATSHMKGENHQSVQVNKGAYGVSQFYCENKLYHSDVQLPKFQGCQTENISFGPGGLDAKLITVFYDWEPSETGVNRAKRETFIEKPDGALYRLKNTDFLTSHKLQAYFETMYGKGNIATGESNIHLKEFSVRNIQSYGNTFCVTHFLKFPFTGAMGWCQNDLIVGGTVQYLEGAMSFGRAAIIAQNYAFEKKLKLRGAKLFHPETVTVLKKDAHGWMYWGFGVPAMSVGKLSYYGLRVYFNGEVFLSEFTGKPSLEEL